jgi:conjugative transposon TraN protein
MKILLLCLGSILGISPILNAQQLPAVVREISISRETDIHILSPEPIQYADISTHRVAGDLPVKNVLRLKLLTDSMSRSNKDRQLLATVTIIGESFITQYRLVYAANPDLHQADTQIRILPTDMLPLNYPLVSLTSAEKTASALSIMQRTDRQVVCQDKAYDIKAQVKHIFTIGDEIFLDILYTNLSHLSFTPDELRFKIEDQRINKATNVQATEFKPEWQLYPLAPFQKQFHNVYVLKKLSFPDDQVLHIELSEKQPSSRTIALTIKYRDLLRADTW